ncbi:hypothetical protein PMNALOAF_3664 [Methylobacterium adhaesivum]|jgi:hypothetical protein|uniref:DUF883 domain-containing protein n=1 Tax=Methylobacterium adhaesivum TaxID=333297 RepID=A0ABT8BGK6_9HYPH|nr:hypothetical protein [Methylobacterium adhaesivum]MDN3590406.1 hypothetical protein [Methylobacterium adhaesivum]GJD32395.1 hypothetical protein PMNALOAF_3664 [Methylobacterium adhaesivum]
MAKNRTQDRVKRETDETNARIATAYEKLSGKFRDRMRKADDKAQAAATKGKQEALRRRSELFGQAAKELEDKVAKLKASGA